MRSMDARNVANRIKEALGPRRDRWHVEVSSDAVGRWVIALSHPASAGLMVETQATDDDGAVAAGIRMLASASTEIEVATAAPELEHADLISGLRTISQMFKWDNREVGAIAFLMFEHGHLNQDETAWLSGYQGIGAPMAPRSPIG
jgi:hypothetical protein